MNPYADRPDDGGTPTAPARRRGDFPYVEPRPAREMPVITPEMVAADLTATGPISLPATVAMPPWPTASLRRMPPHITAALCSLRPELERIATRHSALVEDIDRVAQRLENLEHALRAEGYMP